MSTFDILIDRLRGDQTQQIEEILDPAFLSADEPELKFNTPVHVKGEAYLTESHLIIHLKAKTKALMPCAICNQMIDIDLIVDNFYHTEAIEDIQGAVFNYSEALRESILIELPRTVECNEGNCPERATIVPFLRNNTKDENINKTDCKGEDAIHFPFANMDDLK